MSRRASREARLVRGLVLAAAGAGLGLAGHLVAGGAISARPSLLALVLLAAGACTLLSDREWSSARLLAALGSIEVLVHLGLRLDHHHAAAAAPGSASANGWLMLLGHAAAGLLTAWLLRSGERTYWLAVERLRRRPLPRPATLQVRGAVTVVAAETAPVPAPTRLLDAVSRRGPPALVA